MAVVLGAHRLITQLRILACRERQRVRESKWHRKVHVNCWRPLGGVCHQKHEIKHKEHMLDWESGK